MNAYIYQAALYCEDCARDIKATRTPPRDADLSDERTFDSDDWPKGPYSDGGGEADSPQHCDSCNTFLRNPLTDDGRAYVREQVERAANGNTHVEVPFRAGVEDTVAQWATFYGIGAAVTWACNACGEDSDERVVKRALGCCPHCGSSDIDREET